MTVGQIPAGSPRKVTLTELLRLREERWSSRMRGCSLVAELEVKDEHARQVARVLGRVYDSWTGTSRVTQLFARWPACVAVAITGIAARDYRRGELWPEIWKGLGYRGDQQDQGRWGRGFLDALDDLGLPTFPELPMPYIGPILMHTGIPDYCLEDYLRLVAQRRAADAGLDSEGFLTWATARPHRLDVLDKPARRFLEYGTEYALDFVDRTFDLLNRLRQSVHHIDGVGLPPRVLAKASELSAGDKLDLRAPRTGATDHRRTEQQPRIGLDPFGRGVEVILPAVGDAPDGVARWTLITDGIPVTVRSQAVWAGTAEAAPPTAFTLLRPARTVVVAMEGWDHQKELRVIDQDAPLLAFTEDGRQVGPAVPLPRDNVWVVYPDEYKLTAEGALRTIVEGQLPLGWNGWRLRQVHLDGARSLELRGVPATRRLVRGHSRPRVVMEQPVSGVATPYGTPVCARPPAIWLPGAVDAQTVWSVEIRRTDADEAIASDTITTTDSQTVTEIWAGLPRPLVGSFDVRVRGPLGRGLSRTVFVAEGLDVQFTPRVRGFGGAGLAEARAELSAAIGAQVEPRVVAFAPDVRASVVEYRAGEETEPLVLTPPHVQVMHEQVGQSLMWAAKPLRIWLDAFADEPGSLLVRIPDADTIPAMEVIVGSRSLQHVPPTGVVRDSTARFDLARIADTVLDHQWADLVVGGDRPTRLAAIRPRKLAVGIGRTGDQLQFVESAPVEGLTAGVYVVNAPWRAPTVTLVADDGTVSLPEELRSAGPLSVALQVDDPWAPVEWPRWPERPLRVGGEGHFASDDPSETALSRFLSGEADFPEHVEDLRLLWTLIHLADRLRPASSVEVFRVRCAQPILRRPVEAISALAGIGLAPRDTLSAMIASGLTASAVPDSVHTEDAQKLWPVTPVLAVLTSTLSDPDTFEAARRQCGDTVDAITSGGIDPHAGIGRFGPDVERMIHMSPQQVEGIWRAAQVVPHTLLDPDTRAEAARELFDHREDMTIRRVGAEAAHIVGTALSLLTDYPRLRAQVEARRHPNGLGGWFAVPAASMALAILARLAARGEAACRAAERRFRANWERLAAGAPGLSTIDLVLAELLVGFETEEL